jgi:hypothetical protein
MTFFVEGFTKSLKPESQVRRIGDYGTMAEAIEAAQATINAFLEREFTPGTAARALVALYQDQGECPFIFRNDDKTFNVHGFNHIQYAMRRAGELCGTKK